MDQLDYMRRELCDNFATHQPPVQVAAGLLQGLALDGLLGLPAALADSLLGRGGDFRLPGAQRRAAERRWRLGVRATLARSRVAEALAAEQLCVSLGPDLALTLRAPGAFVLRLQYDLRRWLVIHCALSTQGLGAAASLPPEVEQSWRRQLQGVADEAVSTTDSDVPAALTTAAHAFCSHLWLQACCEEARRATAHGRLREVSSTFWDRRGFASLRILPDWEATCGGICPVASVLRAGDEAQGSAGGCILELHKDPEGGIRPSLPPEFPVLPLRRPPELASGVGPCLDEVLRQAHAAVASVTMRRLREGLLQVVASKRAPMLEESQVELLPDGQTLRCLFQSCWVHVGLEASGRLALEVQGCGEPHRPKTVGVGLVLEAAGGHEGFFLRMEVLRRAALRGAAAAAVAAAGWQSSQGNVPDAPESGRVRFLCRLAEDQPDALEFDLGDSEVSNVSLVVEGGACIHATGLDNFSFVQSGGGTAIADLQKGLRQHLAQARLLLAASTLGREVIVTVAAHAKLLEASGYEAHLGRVASVASSAPGSLTESLEGELCFKRLDAVEATGKLAPTPFASPLRFQVWERPKRLLLVGQLAGKVSMQQSTAILEEKPVPPLPSGGVLTVKVLPNGNEEVTIQYSEDVLSGRAWHRWSRDVRALAAMAQLRWQAACLDLAEAPSGLQLQSLPQALRIRLPANVPGKEVFEVFELVPSAAEPKEEEDADPLISFHWLTPRPSCLFADRLGRRLSRTKRLGDTLHAAAAALELARCVEDVAMPVSEDSERRSGPGSKAADEVWACAVTGATTVQVRCSGMLGVELTALDPSTVRVICLSKRLPPKEVAVVANLKSFLKSLPDTQGMQNGDGEPGLGDAPGQVLRFRPGDLTKRLGSLWVYLRLYALLLKVYLLHPNKGPGPWKLRETTPGQGEPQSWVRLELPLPAAGATACLDLATQAESSTERRAKRRRLSEGLSLRFSCCSDRQAGTEQVEELRAFEAFFARYLAEAARKLEGHVGMEPNWEMLRASRLYPVLQLLCAPRRWMLRETSRLLPPLRRATLSRDGVHAAGIVHSSWQPVVECFSLRSMVQVPQRWQLRFTLTAPPRQCAVTLSTMLKRGSDAEEEGWESVLVDGRALSEFVAAKCAPGRNKQAWSSAAALSRPCMFVESLRFAATAVLLDGLWPLAPFMDQLERPSAAIVPTSIVYTKQ
ncbi:unnamed protein product [Symbiodinium natans]|uniref:Uncharacterized protein n=1 Tax=Symbiodinium natans TaxID=878477 RepID=A0A812HLL0_9DINO|nr:unnamed protein product [Symbiodinium natans]